MSDWKTFEEIFNQPELNPQYDALEWYGQAQLIAKAALEDNQ